MAEKKTWIIQVTSEEQPRAVRAKTAHQARMHVAGELVGEARAATVDDAWRLAAEGIKISEASE
jgi:hypothetical protein